MKFTPTDIAELRKVLAACKTLEIEGVVLYEGLARGAKTSLDAAIISKTEFSIPPELRIGIGRVAELDKRLSAFGADATIELKTNENDVTLMTIVSGKTKLQYRCTSTRLMQYPKENADEPAATVTLTRDEVTQLVRAIKTISPEAITLQITRSGTARIECVDSTNDKFETELSSQVKYADEEDSHVNSYLAGHFLNVIDSAAKDSEEIALVVGQSGSVTSTVKGQTIIIFAQVDGESE